MRFVKAAIGIMLALVMATVSPVTTLLTGAAEYDAEYQINIKLHVEGSGDYNLRAIHQYYDDNEYVSLRDLAHALKGTPAAFNVSVSSNGIVFTSGNSYTDTGIENVPFTQATRDQKDPEYVRKRNGFTYNGYNNHYYTMIYKIDDVYDCYMYLTDVILLLGVDAYYKAGELYIDPSMPLSINPYELEEKAFFEGTNAVLVGDATTGEVYYSYNGDASVCMASTTKLMTYVVVMDAVSKGEISLNDKVTMSENVHKLSYSVDFSFHIQTGATATVSDLLYAMLLPSSNECALALAEAVSGDEATFVKRMNDMAKNIGLSDATKFYNCNGLPTFTEEAFEAKVQNRISANDMFKLTCYIFSVYPEITEITSSTSKSLSSFGRTVYNTNSMLYNMNGVVGLKTGTTNKAGCCLVSALAVNNGSGNHYIVAVELGAEDIVMRNCVSKTLLTMGRQIYNAGGVSSLDGYASSAAAGQGGSENAAVTDEIPDNPEALARLVVWTVRNYLEIPEADNIEVPEDEPGF